MKINTKEKIQTPYTKKIWIPKRKMYVFYKKINNTTYKFITDENRPSVFYLLQKDFSSKKVISLDGVKY